MEEEEKKVELSVSHHFEFAFTKYFLLHKT